MCFIFYTIRVDLQNFNFQPKIHKHFFQKHIGRLEIFSISYCQKIWRALSKTQAILERKLEQSAKNSSKMLIWCSQVHRKRVKMSLVSLVFFCSFTIKAFPLFSCSFADFGTLQINRYVAAPTTSGTYCLNNIWSPPPPLLLPTQNIKNILQQADTQSRCDLLKIFWD